MSCHEHDTARQEVEGCLGPLEAAEELAQGRLVLQFLLSFRDALPTQKGAVCGIPGATQCQELCVHSLQWK